MKKIIDIKSGIYKRIVSLAAAVLTTVILAFVFNAYHQAYVFSKTYTPYAQIAVFLAPDTKIAPEVINEKIINKDGVEKADYISREKVLEKAQNDSSALKSIVLTGENPFSPYFIVIPKDVAVNSAKQLVEEFGKIEGVEEAAFDENIFSSIEKTGKLAGFYKTSVKVIAVIVLVIILAKFIFRLLNEEADFLNYFYNFIAGALAGFIAAGIYYFMTRKMSHIDIVQLPVKYMVYFVVSGILVTLLWEND